jgi:response regulator RpfG family c-di-GMP phosphodiesterase
MKHGPIIIVEDDDDDEEMIEEGLAEIGVKNKIVRFRDCIEAFDYLKNTLERPFLIISDINLPKQTGLEFKFKIDSDPELRRKSIPFIFYSTTGDRKSVNKAYCDMSVQGFFKKAESFEELKMDMKIITDYWLRCKHPNIL